VTYALIAINVLVFVFLQGMGENLAFTYRFSTVPQEIATGEDITTPPQEVTDPVTRQRFEVPGLGPTPISVYLTLFTSMFMHASVMHILGNMLYLWIFGDNIEDDLGHGLYLVFYLLCGIVASLCHVLMNMSGPASMVPSLGASGAISGVLGGYLVMHPRRRVRVLMFRVITDVPGIVAVGLWFVFQVISGIATYSDPVGGGVAYAAHIGGFIAGLVLIKPFAAFAGHREERRGNIYTPHFRRRRW
jgi:membrane associated rhomboid family serine protease